MSNFGAYGDLNSLFTKLKQRLSLRPKTFTGTQDEWDALTVADRQEYEIVNITDDYTPSAGGGHKIEDSEGTELTQRDTLQVGGSLIAEDDPTNEKTIITNGRQTIDYEDWIELTPQEQAAIPEAVIINVPDGGGSVVSGMRFDPTTNHIQIWSEQKQEWVNYDYFSPDDYIVFDNGEMNVPFTNNGQIRVYYRASEPSIYPADGTTIVIASQSIIMTNTAVPTSYQRGIRTTNVLPTTGKKLRIEYSLGGYSDSPLVWESDTLNNDYCLYLWSMNASGNPYTCNVLLCPVAVDDLRANYNDSRNVSKTINSGSITYVQKISLVNPS